MKSVTVCMSSHRDVNKTNACCMAGKSSTAKSDFDSREMKACFDQLMAMVPAKKCRSSPMDRTELLQNVIDYIYDLEDTLQAVSTPGLCGVLNSTLSTRSHDHSPEESDSPSAMTTDQYMGLSAVPGITRLDVCSH